jgi:hypothetical protein
LTCPLDKPLDEIDQRARSELAYVVCRRILFPQDFRHPAQCGSLPGEEAGEFTGDIGFRTSPDAVSGTLGEGRFVLFFPGELHKPGVARPGCAHVRKVVIKIRMED